MSEINLIVFGCLVTFIAAAGAYVYMERAFTALENARSKSKHSTEATEEKLRIAG